MSFKAGDVIIFDTDGSWWDYFINKVSSSTHTGFFISDTHYCEASSKGVVVTPHRAGKISRVYKMPDRYRASLPRALEICDIHHGDRYSVFQAFLAGLLRKIGLEYYADMIDRNWFCSELTAYILKYGLGADVGSVNSALPSDIERFLMRDGWEMYDDGLLGDM